MPVIICFVGEKSKRRQLVACPSSWYRNTAQKYSKTSAVYAAADDSNVVFYNQVIVDTRRIYMWKCGELKLFFYLSACGG